MLPLLEKHASVAIIVEEDDDDEEVEEDELIVFFVSLSVSLTCFTVCSTGAPRNCSDGKNNNIRI